MNSTGKWIARSGALLILIGFFLPSVSVSCSMSNSKLQSFSLENLRTNPFTDSGALILVLLAALVLMALTFIPARTRNTTNYLIFGQLASAGISVLIIIVTLSSLYNKMSGGGLLSGSSLFNYSLEFGAFVLLLGHILAVIGALFQFSEAGSVRSPVRADPWVSPAISQPFPPPIPQPAPFAGARLEVVSGNAPRTTIPVADNFIVGRSRECQVQVSDQAVSRQHFRLRCAAEAWYLQDMGSAAGTMVNGRMVQAIRLNSGDQIKIGDTLLLFKI